VAIKTARRRRAPLGLEASLPRKAKLFPVDLPYHSKAKYSHLYPTIITSFIIPHIIIFATPPNVPHTTNVSRLAVTLEVEAEASEAEEDGLEEAVAAKVTTCENGARTITHLRRTSLDELLGGASSFRRFSSLIRILS